MPEPNEHQSIQESSHRVIRPMTEGGGKTNIKDLPITFGDAGLAVNSFEKYPSSVTSIRISSNNSKDQVLEFSLQ